MKVLAAGLAIGLAVLTMAVVSREWRRAGPPPARAATTVEARIIATPAAVPTPSR